MFGKSGLMPTCDEPSSFHRKKQEPTFLNPVHDACRSTEWHVPGGVLPPETECRRGSIILSSQLAEIMHMQPAALSTEDFRYPSILLSGTVDYEMYRSFREQLQTAPSEGLISVELSTLGGDPEVARMMGEDIRYRSEVNPNQRYVFLGKAAIYSAGTTLMSFFAKPNRYLTPGTRLMIHERKLSKSVRLDGPLTTCIASLQATLNEINTSITIQNEGFANLIFGSSVTMDEVLQKAPSNWYIEANEAKALGLIEDVI
jgi:ATP-dependent protease ClpP protease subunit